MTNNTLKAGTIYRDQHILTAPPARLVAMLYEAAIRALRQAVNAVENGDIKLRWASNARAIEIIEHLSITLDTEKGGRIAADLDRLYLFMIGHLINVDMHNDAKPAREVIALLEPMYQSWNALDCQVPPGDSKASAAAAKNGRITASA